MPASWSWTAVSFDGWTGDLEDDVLPALGSRGELYGYRHAGFWKSMDTYKDASRPRDDRSDE